MPTTRGSRSRTGPTRARRRSRPTCRSRRDELRASIEEAHKRGLKITGHLCSVTYAEAAELGIDNLEHGFLAATDFVTDKQPDACPGQAVGQRTIAALDENGAPFKALVKTLIDRNVALTSTLTVFETFTPGRPMPPGLDVLLPQLKQQFEQNYQRTAQNQQSVYTTLFPKALALERAFVRAGGTLIAGTDPTGGGGVIPGYSNQRQLELLVEAGFTPARGDPHRHAERRDVSWARAARVGSIAAGKQADLVVIDGDPSTTIADVRKVETVFKQGVGFDPAKLIASVSGKVGLVVIGASFSRLCSPGAQPSLPQATEGDFVIKDFKFASGETLPELKIHYRTLGTPKKNAQGVVTNAVLIMHGTGGTGAQFAGRGFAGELFLPGQPLDVTKYFIVMPDDIGHGQSSKPSDGLRAKFPRYGYQDMLTAEHALLTAGARRESPAPGDGHVDGRDAHLAVGRALAGVHGRADAARQRAGPDLRPQPRLAPHRDRRDQERSRVAGRQLHEAAAERAHRGADAVAGRAATR